MTLTQTRTHIEPLTNDNGTYEFVCGWTEERPVPVDGFRFEGRETAEAAARATRKYRPALRWYDPNVPYYDLIVSEHDSRSGFGSATATTEGWATIGATSGPPKPPCDPGTGMGSRTECTADGGRFERARFCHWVTTAVLEALVDADHRVVEIAVVDAYFDLAETVSSTDSLCLRLLKSMVIALYVHLVSVEQADVLERAASNLASRPDVTRTLTATLAEVGRLDLTESYTHSMWRSGPDAMTGVAKLTLEDYVLLAYEG